MRAWMHMKYNSAISCAFGFHKACDGIGALRSEPWEAPCECHCHASRVKRHLKLLSTRDA